MGEQDQVEAMSKELTCFRALGRGLETQLKKLEHLGPAAQKRALVYVFGVVGQKLKAVDQPLLAGMAKKLAE